MQLLKLILAVFLIASTSACATFGNGLIPALRAQKARRQYVPPRGFPPAEHQSNATKRIKEEGAPAATVEPEESPTPTPEPDDPNVPGEEEDDDDDDGTVPA